MSFVLLWASWALADEKRCSPGEVVVGLTSDGSLICNSLNMVEEAHRDAMERVYLEDLGAFTPSIHTQFDVHVMLFRTLGDDWMKSVRMVPHYREGGFRGVKLVGVRAICMKLGFKSGDVVRRVDGQPILEMRLIKELFAVPRASKKRVIDLIRKGSKIRITHRFLDAEEWRDVYGDRLPSVLKRKTEESK